MAAIISLGRLIINYLALSALVLDPRNPRRHSPRQIRQIARSIEAFGFVVPILVDCHNRIVAGHGRFLAAQFLGLIEVPVIRLEHLTEAQAKAFMIADNRLTRRVSLGRQAAGGNTEGAIRARIGFQHRGDRLHDGRNRSSRSRA